MKSYLSNYHSASAISSEQYKFREEGFQGSDFRKTSPMSKLQSRVSPRLSHQTDAYEQITSESSESRQLNIIRMTIWETFAENFR